MCAEGEPLVLCECAIETHEGSRPIGFSHVASDAMGEAVGIVNELEMEDSKPTSSGRAALANRLRHAHYGLIVYEQDIGGGGAVDRVLQGPINEQHRRHGPRAARTFCVCDARELSASSALLALAIRTASMHGTGRSISSGVGNGRSVTHLAANDAEVFAVADGVLVWREEDARALESILGVPTASLVSSELWGRLLDELGDVVLARAATTRARRNVCAECSCI